MQTATGHLTYCTNIHAGESWPDHFQAIRQFFPAIKSRLSPGAPMGIGLRVSHIASMELSQPQQLGAFRSWLQENNAYVFTMNGFPYGGFHHTRVKDQVHAPDWTTRERLEYTIRLFDILAALVPDGMEGGISTSPLSYRHWFHTPEALAEAKQQATLHMLEVVEHLVTLRKATGKMLHLDIEPEPDGILESGAEFIDWFEHDLLAAGIGKIAAAASVTPEEAAVMIRAHVCLCYDICHFAVGYEPQAEVLRRLSESGIKIGKIQISAALKAGMQGDALYRNGVRQAFEKFNESTYLHQVVARLEDGSLLRYPDLPEALADVANPLVKEWRAHFHVPLFQEDFGVLQATQGEIRELLAMQQRLALTSHLEVETYTWEVLPETLKLPIGESITRELEWVKNQLSLT